MFAPLPITAAEQQSVVEIPIREVSSQHLTRTNSATPLISFYVTENVAIYTISQNDYENVYITVEGLYSGMIWTEVTNLRSGQLLDINIGNFPDTYKIIYIIPEIGQYEGYLTIY